MYVKHSVCVPAARGGHVIVDISGVSVCGATSQHPYVSEGWGDQAVSVEACQVNILNRMIVEGMLLTEQYEIQSVWECVCLSAKHCSF